MLASLVMALEQEVLPARLNDTNTTNQILQLFPEIKYYYGSTIETELYVDLTVSSGDFLSLSSISGIEIGKKENARAHLQVYCKNATIPKELAVQFDMDLQMVVNSTIDPSWKLYLNIPQVQISNTLVSHDQVGMVSRNYDNLLSIVLRSTINNINVKWTRPFDITSIDPQTLPFLANMFTNLHATPFLVDEFYYVGFSFMMDPTAQTKASFNRMSDRIAEQYKEVIYLALDKLTAYFTKINAVTLAEQ